MRKDKAQNLLEYVLLTAVSIIAIIAATRLWQLGGDNSSLQNHFETVRGVILGETAP